MERTPEFIQKNFPSTGESSYPTVRFNWIYIPRTEGAFQFGNDAAHDWVAVYAYTYTG